MAYTRNPTWHDWPAVDTIIAATNLERIEAGLVTAAAVADAAATAAAGTLKIDGTNSALKILTQPTSNLTNSTVSGGAINVTNTANNAQGLVVYSANPTPVGDLVAFRAAHTTFIKAALLLDYLGTNHSLKVDHKGTGAASNALNVASTNTAASTAFLAGVETTVPTLKVTHTAPGGDSAVAGISVDLLGTGTAATGILVDSTVSGGTTGALLKLRNNSADKWVVDASGALTTGSVASARISDSTAIGRAVLTGASAAAIRTTLGAAAGPITSSKSAIVTLPVVGTYAIWQATKPITITGVRGLRSGGSAATINARVNSLDLLAADLSLATADSWLTGPAVQNANVVAGDSMQISVRSVAGSPAYISFQIDYTEV